MSEVWWKTFDDQFWIMVAGLVLAFLGTVAKSKCSRIACCGCEVERNVAAEVQLERARMQQEAISNRASSGANVGGSPRAGGNGLASFFNGSSTFSNIPLVQERTDAV